MKRQVSVPIWGKQPIPPGRLGEALASVEHADRCLLESARPVGGGLGTEGYRILRCASRQEAKDAIAKERQGEPHTWRLSMAVRGADVK